MATTGLRRPRSRWKCPRFCPPHLAVSETYSLRLFPHPASVCNYPSSSGPLSPHGTLRDVPDSSPSVSHPSRCGSLPPTYLTREESLEAGPPLPGLDQSSGPCSWGRGNRYPACERICGWIIASLFGYACLCMEVQVSACECVCESTGLCVPVWVLCVCIEAYEWCVLLKYHPFSRLTVHLLRPGKK